MKETLGATRADTRKRLEAETKPTIVDVVHSAVMERQRLIDRLAEIQAFLRVISTQVK